MEYITIRNLSDTTLADCLVLRAVQEDHNVRTLNDTIGEMLPPLQATKVALGRAAGSRESVQYFVVIKRNVLGGLKFSTPEQITSERELRLPVKVGDVVDIIPNAENPPLNEKEVQLVALQIRNFMERNSGKTEGNFWDVISQAAFGREGRSGEKLREVYSSTMYRPIVYRMTRWDTTYEPLDVAQGSSVPFILKECLRTFSVHLYFRSSGIGHDRVQHVLRYEFDFNPESIHDKMEVYHYQCFNQSQHKLFGPIVPMSLRGKQETIRSFIVDALRKQDSVNDEYNVAGLGGLAISEYPWMSTELLIIAKYWSRTLHPMLSPQFRERVETFLVINNRLRESSLDSDCVNLVVGMLFQVEDIDPVPIFRLHQRRKDKGEKMKAPSPPQKELMQGLSHLIGMGSMPSFLGPFYVASDPGCQASRDCARLWTNELNRWEHYARSPPAITFRW